VLPQLLGSLSVPLPHMIHHHMCKGLAACFTPFVQLTPGICTVVVLSQEGR